MNPGVNGQPGLLKAGATLPSPRILQLTFTASGTWRAPCSGYVAVLLIGPGGSGAVAATAGATACRAVGGGAGGMGYKLFKVRKGQVYNVTLGAGGAARSIFAAGTTNGLPGSSSSFVGHGVNMVAQGGQGGTATVSSTAALAGALGGSAYGGDINLQGGSSGDISSIVLAFGLATGGGAPNLLGLPCAGGSITAAANLIGTGGGGTASAGVAGASIGGTNGGRGIPVNANQFWPSNDLFYDLIKLAGAGGIGEVNVSSSNVTDVGAGSGGVREATVSALTSGSAVLGGTGGIAVDSQTVATSGAPTYGGGSGGVAASSLGLSGTLATSAGGQGLLLLAFYPGA